MELKFMDNKKTDQYYIDKIITDLTFIRTHTESLSKSKLEEDEILVDSIMFRLIQVADSFQYSDQFRYIFFYRIIYNRKVYISIFMYNSIPQSFNSSPRNGWICFFKFFCQFLGILEGICRCKKE